MGVVARDFEGGRSLFGVLPVRTVPAGGSCGGVNHGILGVGTLTGNFVIIVCP